MKIVFLALAMVFTVSTSFAGSYYEVSEAKDLQELVSKDKALVASGLASALNKILSEKLVCGSSNYPGSYAVRNGAKGTGEAGCNNTDLLFSLEIVTEGDEEAGEVRQTLKISSVSYYPL